MRGLNTLAKGELQWLGKIPPEALIEVRKVGALPEIRAVLSKGVREISEARPSKFHRTTDQVFDNIEKALAEYKKQLQVLTNKKWKFAAIDIGTWLAVRYRGDRRSCNRAAVLGAFGSGGRSAARRSKAQRISPHRYRSSPRRAESCINRRLAYSSSIRRMRRNFSPVAGPQELCCPILGALADRLSDDLPSLEWAQDFWEENCQR